MHHSPEAMRRFHRAHYQPENMTVVIVGGIAQQPALELVKRTFKNFGHRADCPPCEKFPEPIISGICRREIILPRLEQARLLMAWTAPGVEQLRTAYGLDMLTVLLAEGRTSRLIQDLREERQLVQGICSNFSLQRESSLFTITAWLDAEHLAEVEFLIRAHLDNLHSQEMSQRELARISRLLCNEYAFSTETPNQLTGLYGYYNTIAQAELAVTYPQQIKSFNAQELQKLAQQYLSPQNYAVTVLKPD
jgi:predicted Zn-dependent peptidase